MIKDSIAHNLAKDTFIDPFNGIDDLNQKILRHTSSDVFIKNPIMVLWAMQFVARYEYTVADETVEICKEITIEELSSERIFKEWKKLILTGKKPSLGLEFLRECGWIKYF